MVPVSVTRISASFFSHAEVRRARRVRLQLEVAERVFQRRGAEAAKSAEGKSGGVWEDGPVGT